MTSLRSLTPEEFANDGFPGRLLIAGDTADVPMIRRILASLPAGVTGEVFVEAYSSIQHVDLRGPDTVSVTWLNRSEARDATGRTLCAAKGVRLADALHAWLGEWVLADDIGDYRLWIGARTIPRVSHLCAALQSHLDHRAQHAALRTALHEGEPE